MSTSFKKIYPSYNRKLFSNSPHIFSVKSSIDSNASEIVDAWVEKVLAEIEEKMQELRFKSDSFSGDEKTTL